MLRRILVAIIVLIVMNISFYIIIVWISIIFVNFGIDVDKLILMIVVIMIGVSVGIFIAVLIIDYFFRRLFGFILFIIIVVLGYIYLIQIIEWAILIYGLVMIFFLYMYVCFASAVYISEFWLTYLRLRGSGFVNVVGRIVVVFTFYGVAVLLIYYGSITVFMVFGVMLLFCALVFFIFGIETRKVSLEEIFEVN